jgi:cell division protease FtsH
MSGADIERMVRSARQAARRAGRALVFADLEDLFAGRHRAVPHDLRWRFAVHEAGHVIAHRALGYGEPLAAYLHESGGVTIPNLGYREPTETQFMNELAILLAGRAAEELLLGTVSAGAGTSDMSDLAIATRLALQVEYQFGFKSLMRLTDHELMMRHSADPEVAERVEGRLRQAYETARAVLRQRPQEIEAEARKLMGGGT